MNVNVQTGRVVGWSPIYGWIRPDDGGPDVFFSSASCDSRRQVYMHLRRGDRVSFTIVPDPRRARKVMAGDVLQLTNRLEQSARKPKAA